MRRFASRVLLAFSIISCFAGLSGCGSSNPVGTAPTPTPTKVILTPSDSSLDLGATLLFSAVLTPPVITPVVYTSSNPSVLSFVPSSGGLACAGRWDTLARVCTPQGAGFTQVTATANGVTSQPVNVYVHEHVDLVELSLINPPDPQPDCITLAQGPGIQNFLDFQAHASRLTGGFKVDITNTVGSFTFSQTNPAVAKLNTTDPALNNNNGKQVTQARFAAATPGLTQIFASIAGVSSLPAAIPDSKGVTHPYFETCLVQSINLQVGNGPTNTSFSVAKGTSNGVSITPTVTDRLGNELKNPIPALTWISSSPANATVTASSSPGSSAGTASVGTGQSAGGVGITAECFAPTCNVGLQPIQPVYSTTMPSQNTFVGNPIVGLITGAPLTTGTVYVTTTQCDRAGGAISGCQPFLFPVDIKTNAPGVSTILPNSPNSLIFPAPVSSSGTATSKAYLGSSGGLMIFTPGGAAGGSVTQLSNVPGKVLAISLAGDKAIVSDTKSIPNQVYIVNDISGTPTAVPLLISGVTAATFSPDGLKAFLISGSTMHVYSPSLAFKSIALPAAANAVSSYVNGALAYVAGPNGVTMRNTCDTTYAQAASFPGGSPALFRALDDGIHALGVESPGLDVFTSQVIAPDLTVPNPNPPHLITCPFRVTSATSGFVNLGQGTFTPLKLLVAPDNSRAYILASNLGSIFVVDLGVNAVSSIPLTGNPVPLDASLTPDGSLIYVGTNDGSVHVVSTVSGGDLQQITFTTDNSSNQSSLCSNIPQTCNPDLVAVQP
jgi:hypothetical protein